MKTFKNVAYERVGNRVEHLDVYEPGGAVPPGGWPVLIAIHGGGWRRFDKNPYGGEVAAQFNGHGYAVVAVDYALSRRTAPSWPANFADIRATVQFLHAHAGRFHLDTSRVAAIGESAGGHLATLLATDPTGSPAADPPSAVVSSRDSALVDAVIDFYGPSDLSALYATSPVARVPVEQFLGGTPDQVASRYQAASPVDFVTGGDPPMLLIHGTNDQTVPISQSRELAQALTSAGVPNQLIAVPGADHGFEFGPQGRQLLPQMLAFLDASLKH